MDKTNVHISTYFLKFLLHTLNALYAIALTLNVFPIADVSCTGYTINIWTRV